MASSTSVGTRAPLKSFKSNIERKPEAREAAVDDDKVSLRYDYSGPIPEGGRDALDQAEETVAARLNVRTVLNVVGRPEALRCCIVSLVEKCRRLPGLMPCSFLPWMNS
jgi:hypothetical protein